MNIKMNEKITNLLNKQLELLNKQEENIKNTNK